MYAADCCSRCNKLQCAGIIYPIFKLHFTRRQQVWTGTRSKRGREPMWWLCAGTPEVKGQLFNHVCMKGKGGKERVFCFAYRTAFFFPKVDQRQPLKASVSHLPSPLSSLHNPFIFWPPHHHIIKFILNL